MMSAFFNGSVVIAVAERVRDDAIAVYPGWCSPSDVEVKDSGDGFPLLSGDEHIVDDEVISARVTGYLIEMFLKHAADVETNLIKTGHFLAGPVCYGRAFTLDEDGNVKSIMGAAIPNSDGTIVVINLDLPVVDEIVRGCCERSIADRVRVFSQLVRFFREAVGFHGSVETFPSGFVSGFGKAIGLLTDAIRMCREQQAAGPGSGSDDPKDD